MKLSRLTRHAILAVAVTALVGVFLNPIGAIATHEPADKAVAAANDLAATSNNNAPITVLQETMRVSTTSDLILQLTSECSILTSLLTNGQTSGPAESDSSFGQVKMFIEIDGKRVIVSDNDTPAPPPSETDTTGTDLGEVVFCNRAYQRTVTDAESPADGHDREDDFIRTRTANAFNWLALNAGVDQTDGGYDDPAIAGNNVVQVVVKAEFTKNPGACTSPGADGSGAPLGQTCAEALIGTRSLIIEPTHASVHEQPSAGTNTGS